MGKTGKVFAFEPHLANANSLLRNIKVNQFANTISTLSCALHDNDGFFPFYYHHPIAGSSQSQLDSTTDDQNNSFDPVAVETKAAFTLDALWKQGVVQPPHHIKIDVDGNEMHILRGMRQLLKTSPPISIQVEINPQRGTEIHNYLAEFGFKLHHRHDTELGKKKISSGHHPEKVSHNAVFRR